MLKSRTSLFTRHGIVAAYRRVATIVDTVRFSEHRGIGLRMAVLANNISWKFFRLRNPDATFADFYADQIGRKLDRGRPHKTLGGRAFKAKSAIPVGAEHDTTSFAQTGKRQFDMLLACGLQPSHVLVDFGCGSLRVGQHAIRYLDPAHYWGLDVTSRFIGDGLSLIGETVTAEKQPQLRRICGDALAEVQAVGPDFVISIAVLKHVPEAEIDTYFDRLTSLVVPGTTLLLSFSAGPRGHRILGKSWSYPIEFVEGHILSRRPGATFERMCTVKKTGASVVYLTARWGCSRSLPISASRRAA
ncbi:hypothetical protein FHS85_004950 [Rhodoligotrophos appendicifer]|uniref:SAM-dependent methyltransferase n=1 Tax=Rhodoligotrophos appendicifer TaxID=987056 RepID=UPI001186A0C5|nr:class I SAM-dependent methyltransferase [Rhodoligotrophos appendicifer]